MADVLGKSGLGNFLREMISELCMRRSPVKYHYLWVMFTHNETVTFVYTTVVSVRSSLRRSEVGGGVILSCPNLEVHTKYPNFPVMRRSNGRGLDLS